MHRRFAALTLAGIAVARLVMAQPATPYASACEATAVSKAEAARAHTVFLSGRQYLDESSYDKAIQYFLDAYSIDCSVHGILKAIASAYERKGAKMAAVDALDLYLRRAPTASDRDVIERRVKNLRDQIEGEVAAANTVLAPPAPPRPESAPAPTTPVLMPRPKPSPSTPIAPWVLGGLGGAAAVVGSALAVVGGIDVSGASSQCASRVHCPADAAIQGNRGRTLEQTAAVVLPTGFALIASGVLWHLLARSGEGTGAAPPAGIVVGPGRYAGIAVDVTF